MKLPPFDYACPTTLPEAVAAPRLSRRRRQGDRGRPEPGADARLPARPAHIARRPAQARRSARDQDFGCRASRSAPWCAGATSKTTSGSRPRIRCSRPRSAHVAHYQIRNRGTVGGSIAHADPAAEMPGIAITCDAEIAVVGKSGAHVIQAADFFQGALTTALTPDEIIVEIRLPAWPAGRRWGFQEFARRRGDFAMAAAAVFYDQDARGKARNAHVGVIGVGDRPLRLSRGGRCAQWRNPSTRRRSRRPMRLPPPRLIPRTTFMPAPPTAARSSAPWSSARSGARPPLRGRYCACRCNFRSTAKRSRSRSSRG